MWASRLAQDFMALGHPLRLQVLYRVYEQPSCASELARLLGAPLPNTAYHVGVLERADLIACVAEHVGPTGAISREFALTARGERLLNVADTARHPEVGAC